MAAIDSGFIDIWKDCLSKVNPETRAEVRKNMEKMLNKEKLNAVRNRMMIVCRIYDELDEKNLDIDQFIKMMQWDNETAMKYLSCEIDIEDSVLDQINDCLGVNVKDYDRYNII